MRNRYILLADLPMIGIAAFGAFALRFDWLFWHSRPEFLPFLLAALLVKPLVLFPFEMYGRYWRYATARDLVAVVLAVSASSLAMTVGVAGCYLLGLVPHGFSRPVLLIDWLATLTLLGGLRMTVRVVGEARQTAQKRNGQPAVRRVLIVGAGEAGILVAREMQKNPQLGLEPVGFLDDAGEKLGKSISGVRVLGPLDGLGATVREGAVDEVVIAIPTASGGVLRRVAAECQRARVRFRAVPGVFELLDGHVSVSRLREIDIADLLRRSPVVSAPDTAKYLAGRPVLITGAGGSIGSELCRQVAFARPASIVLLGHGENSIFEIQERLRQQFPEVTVLPVIADIRDAARMERVFARHRPAVVFHAAAHKHVPLMEENPEEAISNNVLGTLNVVTCARKYGANRFVLISTDKAVAPSSVMGASKRVAEAIVRAAGRDGGSFVVVRFGNVLGSRGSVVPTFKRQIANGGPITLTHPAMKRFFMTIPEAVHLILQAGGIGQGGELFVLKMGEPVALTDLANDMIKLSGCEPGEIPVVFTGIRRGEKLEESLWEAGAVVEVSDHPEVLRVFEQASCGTQLDAVLDPLLQAGQRGDRAAIEMLLGQLIPTLERDSGDDAGRAAVAAWPLSAAGGEGAVMSHGGRTGKDCL